MTKEKKRNSPTPRTTLKSLIVQSSNPAPHCTRFTRPTSFRRGSFGQGPMAHLNRCSLTSSNPAAVILWIISPAVKNGLPNAIPAPTTDTPHSSNTVPRMLSSSDFGTTPCSACSMYPPGFRCLNEYSRTGKLWERRSSHACTLENEARLVAFRDDNVHHCLSIKLVPVIYGAIETSYMNKVKTLWRVKPWITAIVHFKS